MKTTICDPCKKEDNAITETLQYTKVKGKPYLRVDVCPKHNAEIKKMNMIEYVRYCFKLNGIELKETDKEVKKMYLS